MCGMRVSPKQFLEPKLPIQAFERTMGGRYPHSKEGIIKNKEVKPPQDVVELVIEEFLQLSEMLGIETRPKEELGLTKNLWEDPLAILTGAAGYALQRNVSPLVGNAVIFGGGVALTRGGNAAGGAGGKAAKVAGSALYSLGGRNIAQYLLDSRRQSVVTNTQLPSSRVPVAALGSPAATSICPTCGKQNSTTPSARPIDFSWH
jgi:hypothetical protein